MNFRKGFQLPARVLKEAESEKKEEASAGPEKKGDVPPRKPDSGKDVNLPSEKVIGVETPGANATPASRPIYHDDWFIQGLQMFAG